MATTMYRDPAARLRAESETTRDDACPIDTMATRRGRRTTVYSVRLSAGEQARVEAAVRARHLPTSTLVRSWILGWMPRRVPDDAPTQRDPLLPRGLTLWA